MHRLWEEDPLLIKVVDSKTLMALETRASSLRLSQKLGLEWLAVRVDPAGARYLRAGLWHQLAHLSEVSPHLRCELLLRLRGGEQVVPA